MQSKRRGRKPSRCPDPDALRRLVELESAQLKTVCAHFGTSNKTVRVWLNQHGIYREVRRQRPRGVKPQWLGCAFAPVRGKRVKSVLYNAWWRMRYLCNSKRSEDYRWYGIKGIGVCPEWNDFAAFREWALTNGFRKGLTLHRLNTDGDFKPSNCGWGTRQVQTYNSACTEWITYNGETLPSPVWAKRLGLHPTQLRQRFRQGWSVADAMTVPKGALRPGQFRGRRPYPTELREVIAARKALDRAINRRLREEQDR